MYQQKWTNTMYEKSMLQKYRTIFIKFQNKQVKQWKAKES